ncbi:MAG: helix-turn-helix domain-containing protein [Bacteroidota bacterium]
MPKIAEQNLLTTKQAAQLIDVHESSVKRWCKEGKIPCDVTEGGHRRISLHELLEFADTRNLHCSLSHFLPEIQLVWRGLRNAQNKKNYDILFNKGYTWLRQENQQLFTHLVKFCLEQGISFSELFDELISRALRQMGVDWQSNVLDIGTEHHMTEIVRDILHEIRLNPVELRVGSKKGGRSRQTIDPQPVAVVGCNAGNLHDLGAHAIRIILEERGWRAIYVGANVPADDLAKLQARHNASLVCISFVSASMINEAERFIEILSRFYNPSHPYHLAIGGYDFPPNAGLQLERPPFIEINTYRSTNAFTQWLDQYAKSVTV